jgi:hypothetical protein
LTQSKVLVTRGSSERELISGELANITAVITSGLADVAAEDASRRQLFRLLSALRRLLDEHPVDSRGWCRACGRRRRCLIDDLLASYTDDWLITGCLTPMSPRVTHAAAQGRQWLHPILPAIGVHGRGRP